MNHPLLAELFRSAGQYHAALAEYAAVMRAGGDIETAAQGVLGTSLRYRRAIDRLLEEQDLSREIVATRSRLQRLRTIISNTSRQYNLLKRSLRP